MATPWWTSTVIYQIYPRSFADSNGDGIGDLQGVLNHLDHLVDLGVGTLWLSPFFDSPQRDVGYDIRNYRDVAPEYGTIDDAQRLIDEAHGRGLKVMFDLVLNHSSDEHPWFLESRSSRDNPKADWYVWADGSKGVGGKPKPPNNWRSELQLSRAWQWGEEREQWFLASFLSFQPDLNWRNPELRAEMFDMVRMWLGRGVDGFRLDIFGNIMQDQQLRNNDPRPMWFNGMPRVQRPIRTVNTPENFQVAVDLRAVCDEFDGDRVLIGEVFGSPQTLRSYVTHDGKPGLQMVFLFEFLASSYGANKYRKLIETYETEFPAPLVPTYVVENHDRTRSLSRLGGDLRKAKVVATLLCTLRGVPVIYQGQEIGMENRYIPIAEANDPVPGVVAKHLPEWLNRKLPERLNRDEVRTPMQWSAGDGAGFTKPGVQTWLPIHDNHDVRNVQSQSADEHSLLNWYKELLKLRAYEPALHEGSLTLLNSDPDVIAFHREHEGRTLTVVCNLGDRPHNYPVPSTGASQLALVAQSDVEVHLSRGDLVLGPHSSAIVEHLPS